MIVDCADHKDCKNIVDILKKLSINRETVVVAKNGTLCPESEAIGLEDELDIIQVVYGG